MTSGKNDDLYPLGIKYWIAVKENEIPKFEVYVCIGQLTNKDYWAFRSFKRTHLISKSYSELIENKEFKPFLLNLETLRKKYGAL